LLTGNERGAIFLALMLEKIAGHGQKNSYQRHSRGVNGKSWMFLYRLGRGKRCGRAQPIPWEETLFDGARSVASAGREKGTFGTRRTGSRYVYLPTVAA